MAVLLESRNQLKMLAAGLLEPVPFERADTAEELAVRLAALPAIELDQGEFDGGGDIAPMRSISLTRSLSWLRR